MSLSMSSLRMQVKTASYLFMCVQAEAGNQDEDHNDNCRREQILRRICR